MDPASPMEGNFELANNLWFVGGSQERDVKNGETTIQFGESLAWIRKQIGRQQFPLRHP